MREKKKLLFITWDSETSNYMETLFFPIFHALSCKYGLEVSVIQFSWADQKEIMRIEVLAKKAQIQYFHFPVYRNPIGSLAAFFSLWIQRKSVLKLMKSQNFDWIMPRSTMPALLMWILANKMSSSTAQIIFDADGLPIQERVDFSGLKNGSSQHRFLSRIEKRILRISDKVLTRSNTAIDWHLSENADLKREKFYKVVNGRDPQLFRRDASMRKKFRAQWRIGEGEKLLVHSGSLGSAYHLKPVFELMEKDSRLKLLLLTRSINWVDQHLPEQYKERVIIIVGDFKDIPSYLSAADLGICLRTPAPSLKGLAPIKLGEYLLCGLPVWVSPGIGDLQQELGDKDCCCFEDQHLVRVLDWLMGLDKDVPMEAREIGLGKYSLEASVLSYGRALGC